MQMGVEMYPPSRHTVNRGLNGLQNFNLLRNGLRSAIENYSAAAGSLVQFEGFCACYTAPEV